MRSVLHRAAGLTGLFVAALSGSAQQMTALQSSPKVPASRAVSSVGLTPLTTVEASLRLALTQANPAQRGEAWLEVTADSAGPAPAHVVLRIPLSSTQDAYGESRSCKVPADGVPRLVFTAGLDEKNFLPFAVSKRELQVRLLLNKYLCRALAAPFRCGDREVRLPSDWTQWRLARRVSVVLSSAAPAVLLASPVVMTDTHRPFDPASCATVAPSNGICCVAHQTTEWHCGGKPAGPGWHQVSGDCYHRETGGRCEQ